MMNKTHLSIITSFFIPFTFIYASESSSSWKERAEEIVSTLVNAQFPFGALNSEERQKEATAQLSVQVLRDRRDDLRNGTNLSDGEYRVTTLTTIRGENRLQTIVNSRANYLLLFGASMCAASRGRIPLHYGLCYFLPGVLFKGEAALRLPHRDPKSIEEMLIKAELKHLAAQKVYVTPESE